MVGVDSRKAPLRWRLKPQPKRRWPQRTQRAQKKVGAGWKPALLALAHREICPSRAIISESSTRFFPDWAGTKRFACRRTAATETRNISRKDAKAAEVTGDARHPEGTRGIEERFLPRVEMTVGAIHESAATFAPWREEYPNQRGSSITEHLRRQHAMTNMLVLVLR